MIYPKRFSRAKRKKLRAQKGFIFTQFIGSFSTDWAKSNNATGEWLVLGGDFSPNLPKY